MGGRRIIEEDVDSHGLLLFTAGAIAGAATGIYLARRYDSLEALVGAARSVLDEVREAWIAGVEEGSSELLEDEDEIDDDEVVDEVVDEADVEDEEEEEEEEEEDDEEEDDELVDEDDDETSAGGVDDLDAEFEDEADDEEEDDLVYDVDARGARSPAGAEPTTTDREVDRSAHVDAETRDRREARALALRVLAALRGDDRIGRRPVEIAVVGDGVVELTGSVRSHDEAARAAAAAREVEGVQMVLNRLDVRTGGHVETASVPRASRTDDVRPGEPGAPEA